jgi:hypothetical protein
MIQGPGFTAAGNEDRLIRREVFFVISELEEVEGCDEAIGRVAGDDIEFAGL